MFSTTIEAGDVYVHRMAGGGGWGDPLVRDPAAVADDVANEKVSVEAARELYGVVIGPTGRWTSMRRPSYETRGAVRDREGRCGRDRRRDHGREHGPLPDEARLRARSRWSRSARSAAGRRSTRPPTCGSTTRTRSGSGSPCAARQMFANAEEELGGPAGFEQIGYMLFAPPEEASRRSATPSPCSRASASRRRLHRAGRGRGPLARASARGRRARLLRADVRLRRTRCSRSRRSSGRPSATGSQVYEGCEVLGITTATAASPGSSPATARSPPASSSTPAARGATGSAGMAGVELPDQFSREHEAIFDAPEGFEDFPVISDVPQAPLLPARTSAARCSSARAGRSRRSRWTPRPTTTGPTRRTCRQDGAEAPQPPARARADAHAAELRRRVRDRLLRRLRHHRGLVSDRRRGGARAATTPASAAAATGSRSALRSASRSPR